MSDLVSILKLDEGRADIPRDVASLLCRAHVEIEQLRAKLAAAEAKNELLGQKLREADRRENALFDLVERFERDRDAARAEGGE